ncbi:MAG: hypothetical protein F4081_07630 [Dehalococcoidia bacterium]|nr:hypothetical protein [Dehalococcoidia bacterium]MYI86639.1 hypothetical protein [Dehalococcoidia bacterium]
MPPEMQPDALTDVVTRLETVGIDYMLTGSAAGLFCGLSRSTGDFDIVLDLAHEQVAPLVDAFYGDYYIEPDAVFDAVERASMFNVIPMRWGLKTDFIVLGHELFDLTVFERRRQADWHGAPIWVIRPADLVLSKLRWARESYSGQQLADIRAIMASGLVSEDDDFRGWIERLRLREVLDASRTTRYDA